MRSAKFAAKQIMILPLSVFLPQIILRLITHFSASLQTVTPTTANGQQGRQGIARLRSNSPYHEVVTPFTIDNGQIVTSVKLNGQATVCTIDTGCRDILWSGLKVDGAHTPRTCSIIISGRSLAATGMYLDSVGLGSFTLNDAFTMGLYTEAPQPVYTIVGSYAFQQLVMTIDYPRRTLILRDTSYDITKLPLSSQDTLVDIDYEPGYNTYREFGPSRIYVKMQIEGHTIPVQVDTGYRGGILLCPEIRNLLAFLPADQKLSHPDYKIANAAVIAHTVRPLHWTLNNLHGQAAGEVLSEKLLVSSGVSIGYELLRDYRMTIDYGRKKMLLEYAGSQSPR